MKLLKKYGLFIFWILLFLDCFLINFKFLATNRVYTKPLLLITLAVYFYINTKRSKHWRSKSLVYIALLASWLADLCFLVNDFSAEIDSASIKADTFLFLGISLLLVCFLMYAISFKRIKAINIKDCQEAFLSFLAMALAGVIYYKIVSKEDLGIFKPLVIATLIVLTIMLSYAANIFQDKVRRNMTMKFFVPGAITLILTMGIIIARRFYLSEAEFLPAVIELTYGFGQMLMLRGFTKYLKA